MRQGAEIDYVIGWMNLPLKWKTIIKRYDPPRLFEDQQARGPYSMWHHLHPFEESPAGTIVSDRVDYRLPLGILGRMAHTLAVKRQLLAIFRYRQRATAKLLKAPGISFDNPSIVSQR
jgi:ligand-binding SRPBCC domain-containing protein